MELVWCPIAIPQRSLVGRKPEVMVVVLERMIPSHVTVMATMTSTCDRHPTAIETHARALAHPLAGIDVVIHPRLVVAIVLCMVNMVPMVVVATMAAAKLAHGAVGMEMAMRMGMASASEVQIVFVGA